MHLFACLHVLYYSILFTVNAFVCMSVVPENILIVHNFITKFSWFVMDIFDNPMQSISKYTLKMSRDNTCAL